MYSRVHPNLSGRWPPEQSHLCRLLMLSVFSVLAGTTLSMLTLVWWLDHRTSDLPSLGLRVPVLQATAADGKVSVAKEEQCKLEAVENRLGVSNEDSWRLIQQEEKR